MIVYNFTYHNYITLFYILWIILFNSLEFIQFTRLICKLIASISQNSSHIDSYVKNNQIQLFSYQFVAYNLSIKFINKLIILFLDKMKQILILATILMSAFGQLAAYSAVNSTNSVTQGLLKLTYSADSTNVYFGAVLSALQWFAIGVFPNNASGGNITADLWVFNIYNNTVNASDQYVANSTWSVDTVQNIMLTGATLGSSSVSVNFYRTIADSDWQDEGFVAGTAYSFFFYTSANNLTDATATLVNISSTVTIPKIKITKKGKSCNSLPKNQDQVPIINFKQKQIKTSIFNYYESYQVYMKQNLIFFLFLFSISLKHFICVDGGIRQLQYLSN
ncbi:hypothetical protein pb186bvf_006222 [Paramecium bursaria]